MGLVQSVSGSNGTNGTNGTTSSTSSTGSTSSTSSTGTVSNVTGTVEKVVKGSVSWKMATKALCQSLGGSAGIAQLKTKFAAQVAGVTTTNIKKLSLACSRRRLSDEGRRLTSTATLSYEVKVAAGATVNAATVQNNINAMSKNTWKTIIESAATAAGISGVTVDTSTMTITATTTSTVSSSDSSFAGQLSTCSLPVTLFLLAWKQFA